MQPDTTVLYCMRSKSWLTWRSTRCTSRRSAAASGRSVAPLKQEEDARLLDTTDLTIEQAVNQILAWSREALQ